MKEVVLLHSSRTDILLAGPQHNCILRELNDSIDWGGFINFNELYGDNPYDTLMSDGVDGDIIMCRDNRTGRFFGFGAACIHLMYVDGTVKRVAYYNAVKLIPEYQHKTMAFPLMIKAAEKLLEGRADISFMLAYDTETELKKMYEKKRKMKPSFNRQCMSTTIFFRPCKSTRLANKMSLQTGLTENVRNFFDIKIPEFNMVPILDEMTRREKIWVSWEENGKVKAACALDDVQQRRGYFLKEYGGILKFAKHLPIQWLGYPSFPEEGALINCISVSMLMFESGISEKEMANFVKAATSFVSDYDMCFLSLTDTSPYFGLIRHIRHVNFDYSLYTVDWGERTDITRRPVFAEETIL